MSAVRCPQTEFDHCVSRERAEREAAHRATDPAVRNCHQVMAERYADRAWSLSEGHDFEYAPRAAAGDRIRARRKKAPEN